MDINLFLKGKEENLPEIEKVVTKRYMNEEGEYIPFKFRAISSKRLNEIKKECTSVIHTKGQKIEKFNNQRFINVVGIESTTFPNFKDSTLLESYDCIDPNDLVQEILKMPGEYSEWVETAFKINGFDDTFEELVEKGKN